MPAMSPARTQPMDGFSAPTRAWFAAAFAEPTPAQAQAWASIGQGDNTLVVAPTGSGKTLAAFLWAIDKLATEPVPADPQLRCRVLYISPLKALAVDIERNLRSPLTGIGHAAHAARPAGAGHPGRRPHRRHGGRRAPQAGRQAAGHPDHHAGVAVPAADLEGPRGPARRRDGHRRRGARPGRRQARRAPGAVPGAAGRAARRPPGRTQPRPGGPRPGRARQPAARPSGSGCRPRCGRPRRSPRSSAAPAR